ncbi:hypothetical protein [Okeania sp. KiyG1]|uniref:hypothetical protein n=1 Tax=Okeania sp. KiyG1 TaxID=2720165 RepID=UPI0019224087|nr:hypothetical protein [Okeania sp. KiyG1]GFZ92648.1 hypothetical protein CYANOKiyG1_03370 [Okeania sp. KiyG1]
MKKQGRSLYSFKSNKWVTSYQKHLDIDEVVGNIREAVRDEHDIQVYSVVLIKAGSIPKTSSVQ